MLIINAVIFDLDGLLIDSEIIAKIAWARGLGDFNYTLSDDFYLKLVGVTLKDEINLFYEQYGDDFPFEKVYEKRQQYYDEIIQKHGIQLKPGAKDLIALIDRSSIRKGVATSSSRQFASKKLEISGLDGNFDAMVFGDEVKEGKPSPDIFLMAASRLYISPKECIVLEDSTAGILAANAAGMIPFMIPDLQAPSQSTQSKCYHVFHSLIEVRDYIACFLA